MKTKTKKLFVLILLFNLLFTLVGCGGFMASSDVLEIASIEAIPLGDGSKLVTITYTDEEIKPTEFIIPKGKDGEDGTGIKLVSYRYSPDNTKTIVDMTFTNEERVSIDIPNGVSVSDIKTKYDETTGDTEVRFVYSDGRESDPIIVPKGKQGEDGISITGTSQRINRDYSVTLTFHMSKGDDVVVEIPAPQQGVDGRGIKDIVTVPSEDSYIMKITFTDDTTQELNFARPNRWFSEMSEPDNDLDGIDGDLWYDLAHQVIYLKQNGKWVSTMDFTDVIGDGYKVTFNLNDSKDAVASLPKGSLFNYTITKGKYFASSGYQIPIPTRDGYIFAGWYTSKNPTPVNGKFTDLTIVQSDLTLYAAWEKK